MRFQAFLACAVVIAVVVVSGCTSTQPITPDEDLAKLGCISLCKSYTDDLSNGPCLSDDNAEWAIDDWVCDVAHSPRTDVDNLPENQCQDFRNGKASHFVEVDENCDFIRAH